jgi:hypothetical protein
MHEVPLFRCRQREKGGKAAVGSHPAGTKHGKQVPLRPLPSAFSASFLEPVQKLNVLKGHGFSRAACQRKGLSGFSPRGNLFSTTCIPSAAKAASSSAAPTARLKPCPFKTRAEAVPFQI